MIVAGIGLRRGASSKEIIELVTRAAAHATLSPSKLSSLATLDARAHEDGLIEAADHLGLHIVALASEALRAMADRVETQSPRILALHGVGSIAEASALAAAGADSRLLLGRIASGRVTCAIARGGLA